MSYMMWIAQEFRWKWVGQLLLNEHIKRAKNEGIKRIFRTFDPLESMNANLNIHKARGVVGNYLLDFYGEMPWRNEGLATDRFELVLDLEDREVQDAYFWWKRNQESWVDLENLRDKSLTVVWEDGVKLAQNFFPNDDQVIIRMPYNFQQVKTVDNDKAISWREITRSIFVHYLNERGYIADEVYYYAEEQEVYLQLCSPKLAWERAEIPKKVSLSNIEYQHLIDDKKMELQEMLSLERKIFLWRMALGLFLIFVLTAALRWYIDNNKRGERVADHLANALVMNPLPENTVLWDWIVAQLQDGEISYICFEDISQLHISDEQICGSIEEFMKKSPEFSYICASAHSIILWSRSNDDVREARIDDYLFDYVRQYGLANFTREFIEYCLIKFIEEHFDELVIINERLNPMYLVEKKVLNMEDIKEFLESNENMTPIMRDKRDDDLYNTFNWRITDEFDLKFLYLPWEWWFTVLIDRYGSDFAAMKMKLNRLWRRLDLSFDTSTPWHSCIVEVFEYIVDKYDGNK